MKMLPLLFLLCVNAFAADRYICIASKTENKITTTDVKSGVVFNKSYASNGSTFFKLFVDGSFKYLSVSDLALGLEAPVPGQESEENVSLFTAKTRGLLGESYFYASISKGNDEVSVECTKQP
jgi:hypothetical protein